jgi:flagellar biosynthesis protein
MRREVLMTLRKKTKTTKRAAVLKYNPEENGAPVLTAYGEGHMADKLADVAEKAGVPVVPDAALVSALAGVGVGSEIPEELYEVVARILLFVSEMDAEYAKARASQTRVESRPARR